MFEFMCFLSLHEPYMELPCTSSYKSILFEYAERIKKVATALEEKQRLIEEILQLPHQVDDDDHQVDGDDDEVDGHDKGEDYGLLTKYHVIMPDLYWSESCDRSWFTDFGQLDTFLFFFRTIVKKFLSVY